ncbi:hypothetical protein HDU97_002135 [Phlyctochytrium planicorne]|nr:hypothetical protein HDU97_002135 [Phlyctochytrium planicorne]
MTTDCKELSREFSEFQIPDHDCCDKVLYGIDCANDRVVGLYFSGDTKPKLGRPMPNISKLTALEHIDLSRLDMTGEIPSYLYGFTKLQQLIWKLTERYQQLDRNKFTGQISKDISNLRNLKTLSIQGNYLQGVYRDSIQPSTNVFLDDNCLVPAPRQTWPQRSPGECDGFFKSQLGQSPGLNPTTIRSSNQTTEVSSPNPTGTPRTITTTTTSARNLTNSTTFVNNSTSSTGNSTNKGTTASPSSNPPIAVIISVVVAFLAAATVGLIIYKFTKKGHQAETVSRKQTATTTGSLTITRDGMREGPSQSTMLSTSGEPERLATIVASHGRMYETMRGQTITKDKGGLESLEKSVAGQSPFQKLEAIQTILIQKEPPSPSPTSFPEISQSMPKQSRLPDPYLSPTNEVRRPFISNNMEKALHSDLTGTPSTKHQTPAPFLLEDSEKSVPSNVDLIPTHPRTSVSMAEASLWSPVQVAQWLESVDVSPRLALILKEHAVTGYQLLLMTEKKLTDMGIEMLLSRKIVMEAVAMLRAGTSGTKEEVAEPPRYDG